MSLVMFSSIETYEWKIFQKVKLEILSFFVSVFACNFGSQH